MNSAQRNKFFIVMVRHLLINGKVKTTVARAKYLKPRFEKLITLAGKTNNLRNYDKLTNLFGNRDLSKLFISLAEQSRKERNGGYCSIRRTEKRKYDSAEMASLIWLIKQKNSSKTIEESN